MSNYKPLNSTPNRLKESVALLTKEIGIVTPLVLGIVVCVAPRLISYIRPRNESSDHIVHVVSKEVARSYRTWATGDGAKEEKGMRQSNVSA